MSIVRHLTRDDYLASRTGDPATDSITAVEAKAHLLQDSADQDTYIGTLITAADEFIENELCKALITQTWTVSVPGPAVNGWLVLPVNPVIGITTLKYYDSDNVLQTLTVSDFFLYKTQDLAYLRPNTGISWPNTYDRPDAIEVVFTAGYGDAADVPASIKHAVKLVIGDWFEHRASAIVGVPSVPAHMVATVDRLISNHKIGFAA